MFRKRRSSPSPPVVDRLSLLGVDVDPSSPVARGVNAHAAEGGDPQAIVGAVLADGPRGLVPALNALYAIHDAAEARDEALYEMIADLVSTSRPQVGWFQELRALHRAATAEGATIEHEHRYEAALRDFLDGGPDMVLAVNSAMLHVGIYLSDHAQQG